MTRSARATLADVARRAGVSTTTASYILNGRSSQMRIAAGTEDRVRVAAEALGYRPDPSARSLRTRSTRSIGMISDLVAGGSFASRMLVGAGAAARALDHVLVIGESQGDPELEGLLIEEMLGRRVDGIVYSTLVTARITVPQALRDVPTVLLNCVDPTIDLPAVLPDEHEGGRSAVRELLAGGGVEQVWVIGEDPTPGALAGPERVAGIEAALRESGVTLAGVVPCAWDVRPAYDAVTGFLGQGGRPDGLICLNDRIGMGAYQALADRGLRVPDDIPVVSFDGSDLAGWLRPELTSVVLPYEELGARAVELLLGGDPRAGGVVRLPMPVRQGGSVRRTSSERPAQGPGRPSLGHPTATAGGALPRSLL